MILEQLFGVLALFALTAAGFAWIFGLASLRGRLLRLTAGAVVLGLFLSPLLGLMASGLVELAGESLPAGTTIPFWVVVPVVLGHLVLAIVLIRRHFRDQEQGSRRATELERARTRERIRLPPDPEEPPL